MIVGLTETYGTKTMTQKLESWYGRGITKSMLPYFNRYIHYSKVAVDELYTRYESSPQIGDISEEDVDKLLKV